MKCIKSVSLLSTTPMQYVLIVGIGPFVYGMVFGYVLGANSIFSKSYFSLINLHRILQL